MTNNENSRFPVAKTGMQHQDDTCMKNLAKGKDPQLYDLADLERIFKVTKRTLFTWRSKNLLPLINVCGKLYLTHQQFMHLIHESEGGEL